MDEADRLAFRSWYDADPAHRRALERMHSFDTRMETIAPLERDAVTRFVSRRSRLARRAGGTAIGIMLVLAGAWSLIRSDLLRDRFPDHQTARGEVRAVALADGSQVILDTDAAIRVALGKREREIRLLRGQLLATVAKDRGRPFIVETSHGTATALGTAFIVQRDLGETRVTVIQSQVRVCPAEQSAACLTLQPGQRAIIDGQRASRLPDTDPAAATLWTTGWLEADDEEVGGVLAELNRYRRVPVRFDAAALHGLKVTGSFPLRDPDRALEGVVRSAGLSMHKASDGTITVRRR